MMAPRDNERLARLEEQQRQNMAAIAEMRKELDRAMNTLNNGTFLGKVIVIIGGGMAGAATIYTAVASFLGVHTK